MLRLPVFVNRKNTNKIFVPVFLDTAGPKIQKFSVNKKELI